MLDRFDSHLWGSFSRCWRSPDCWRPAGHFNLAARRLAPDRLGPLHRRHARQHRLRALSERAAGGRPANSLTVQNAAAPHYGLVVGLIWWIIGMVLAAIYFVLIYRMFRGKVQLSGEGY